jgi:arylsulfatase A-like enzyme
VTADHGEGLMQRDYWTHGMFVYEEEVRVPLIVRWPGHVPAGRVIREPVELIDVAPTLLDLAALEVELPDVEGHSLANSLQGDAPLDPDRPIFLTRKYFKGGLAQGRIPAIGRRFGVRKGQWKYIAGPEEGTEELYDLDLDPGETRNVLAEHPAKAKRLDKILGDWRKTHSKILPTATISDENREALRALGYTD